MKTHIAKIKEIERKWYLIDAKDKILGRVATQAAIILRGKHKIDYTSNFDMGDFVVIINAKSVALSGKKLEQKKYFRHSGYPGGLKSESLKNLMKIKPIAPLRIAIEGMIPKNRLKIKQVSRIKIYADENHKHTQKLILI